MAESTLSLTRDDVKRYVGRYLGISRTDTDWDAATTTDVEDIIKAGERSFYHPLVPGKSEIHLWSFMQPVLSVSLSNGTSDYTLADDFGGFIEPELLYATSQTWTVKLVDISRILERRQYSTITTTVPQLGAVTPVTFVAATGQRYQLTVWPTPLTSYTIKGRYLSNPGAIANDAHYPMGGQPHAETLLEACLAAAELHMNDRRTIHRELFAERLAASIALDRGLGSNLGSNRGAAA